MSAPKIPSTYTITSSTTLGDALDFDFDNIRIKEIAPITMTSNSTLNSGFYVDP